MTYPWQSLATLTHDDLNAAFAVAYQNDATSNALAQQAYNSTQARLPISVTLNWSAGMAVAAGDYILTGTAPYAFDILSLDSSIGPVGGSFLVDVLIDGLDVGALANVSVSAVPRTRTIASGGFNTVNIGARVTVTVHDITGTPTDSFLVINGIRTS